jgi:hypothetical protein
MNDKLTVTWTPPTGVPDEDRAFCDAVQEMISGALLDLNKALRKADLPTGNFTVTTNAK